MDALLQAGLDSGLLENAAQLASIAGAIVLLGLLAAFGAFAYKGLRGDIRWPDDDDEMEVTQTGDDEEWKYS
jgi:uncharacterized membrane protein YebE (DUF533 family)